MVRFALRSLAALALVLGASSPRLAAQDQSPGPGDPSQPAPGGWTLTPSLLYGRSWDDNVLLHGVGDNAQGDFLDVLNPRADLEFNNARTRFSASYGGAILLYRNLDTLNSYDQHASAELRRLVTRHVTLFASNSAAVVPTTELSLLVGIPFLRTGSRVDDFRGGVEAELSKRTSMTAGYHYEWVQFDENPAFANTLRGGQSNGGAFVLRYKLSERTALTGDYDREFATFGGGPDVLIDVQNAAVGVERMLTESVRVFAAVGVSHVAQNELIPAHTGPRYRAGLSRRYRTATFDVAYSRSLVPSFGFGGTTENQELSTRVHLPLSRRFYTQGSGSWRSDDSLIEGDPSLSSRWVEAVFGYQVQPWVRIEAFYGGAHQEIARPGGALDRNRLGFQVVTVKPVRIR